MDYWSMAIYDLKLTDEQFYALTPHQFGHLAQRHRYAHEHQERLFGIVAQQVVNFSMTAPKKPTIPQDFMPSMWNRKAQKARRRTDKQIANECRAVFGGLAKASNKQVVECPAETVTQS